MYLKEGLSISTIQVGGDTYQTEVEHPEGSHDQHVGRASDHDQEGEEAPGESQPIQEAG